MNIDQLFLETLLDLKSKTESTKPYDNFMAAPLLRKLLIDSNSLLNRVNRNRHIKITFVCADYIVPNMDGVALWAILDGFEPDNNPPSFNSVSLNRDKLLKQVLMVYEGNNLTVYDVIKYICNVAGAVHSEDPEEEKEQILARIDDQFQFGGNGALVESLKSLSRVVLAALQPLVSAITSGK